jgi:ribosomal protein L7/L12
VTEDELRRNVIELYNAGRAIEAIKLYREVTRKGLAESKHDVETLARGGTVQGTLVVTPSVQNASFGSRENAALAVESLIRNGRKIEAIKLYREQTGLGLKDAKDAVDALEAQLRSGAPFGQGAAPKQDGFHAHAHAQQSAFGVPDTTARKPFGTELPSQSDGFPLGLLVLILVGLVGAGAAFVFLAAG